MGQAKKRGTFEERKAQALEEGREKRPSVSVHKLFRKTAQFDPEFGAMYAMAQAFAMGRARSTQRRK
jgi:hypothetical protein